MARSVARAVSPDAVHNLTKTWRDVFARRHQSEVDAALAEYFSAIYGKPIAAKDAPPDAADFMTSLPLTWAAFFRPLSSASPPTTGRALARKHEKFRAPALSAALDALDAARVLFGDVLHVDARAGRVIVRDAFDGTEYAMPFAREELRRLCRWERIFTVIVPLFDGRWYHPSVFVSHAAFADVEPATFVRETESWLASAEKRELRCDGEPQRWLVSVVGQAYGVLVRLAGRANEQREASTSLSVASRDAVGRLLDQQIPELGAAPRTLAATAAGAEAVERWLRRIERAGARGADISFLDLDGLRQELGLQRIRTSA